MRPVNIERMHLTIAFQPQGITMKHETRMHPAMEVGLGELILLSEKLDQAITQTDLKDEYEFNKDTALIAHNNMRSEAATTFVAQIAFLAGLDQATLERQKLQSCKQDLIDMGAIDDKGERADFVLSATPQWNQTYRDIRDPNVGFAETFKRVVAAQTHSLGL